VPGGIVSIRHSRGGGNPVAMRKPVIAVRREEIIIEPSPRPSPNGEGELPGRVEGVEFRGSVTGYRIRAEAGLLHVDVWTVQHGKAHERGDEVVLRIPASGLLVEGAP
jgi:iron(III) transport system ATP-binding protein